MLNASGTPAQPGAVFVDQYFLEKFSLLWGCNGAPLVLPLAASAPELYVPAVVDCLRKAESQTAPSADYLECMHHHLSAPMRTVLVDWLSEVNEEFRLHFRTLCLAVYMVDRYLTQPNSVYTAPKEGAAEETPVKTGVIRREKLQLLGVACLFVASKYEEASPPTLDDYVEITDHTYTRTQILDLERVILRELDFRLTVPLVSDFLLVAIQLANVDSTTEQLAQYLCEMALEEYVFLRFSKPVLGLSALALAQLTLRPAFSFWHDEFYDYFGCQPKDLLDCLNKLHTTHCRAPYARLQGIRTKYSHEKRFYASTFAPLPQPPVLCPGGAALCTVTPLAAGPVPFITA